MSLMLKAVTVKCVDAAYGAQGSLLFMLNSEMLRKLPIISILALISWWAIRSSSRGVKLLMSIQGSSNPNVSYNAWNTLCQP